MNAPAKYLFDIDFAPAAKAATTVALSEHKALLARPRRAAIATDSRPPRPR